MLALSFIPAGCGSDDGGSGDGGPKVVATTGILADITEQVTGPGVDVEQLIPEGGSPHDFQLSAQARQRLEEADLVTADGADLEATIPLDDVDPVWRLADHVGSLLPFEEGSGDPHVWMDPSRVARAMPSLGAALAAIDPDHGADYRARADAFAARLRHTDQAVVRALRSVPVADRELVTSHDALGYFADRYDLRVVATAFPATGPEAEASAEKLNEVEDAIRTSGVSTVFAGEEDDPETLRIVAGDTGVRVEDGLYVESPGPEAGYPEMLLFDARLIAAGLGG